jgi:hypothetical protein
MEEDDGLGMEWQVQSVESKEKIIRDRGQVIETIVKKARKVSLADLESRTGFGRPTLKRHLSDCDTIEVKRDPTAAYSPLTAFYIGDQNGNQR